MIYDTNIPIYLQIIEKIKRDILIGTLLPGERLPSIQDMAIMMEVNQNTICRVYKECELAGISETRRGIGSFVVDDPAVIEKLRNEKITQLTCNFICGLREIGFTNEQISKVLQHKLKEEEQV